MSKKGKNKANAPVETVEAKDIKTAFGKFPAPPDVSEPTPQVTPEPDPKAALIQALEKEVIEIAGDRDPAYVVWSFNTRDNRTTGSSLKFYMDCKRHEIETGTPCNFTGPAGQPVQMFPGALKLVAPKVKKKCPTC